MQKIVTIQTKEDIPERFRGTPIGDLCLYHNAEMPHRSYQQAELLIGTCMDHRIRLNLPEKFAYIIRTGGANLRHGELHISYAIAVGGVKHIALIGHTQCGMVNLEERKDKFIEGMQDHAGWDAQAAEDHFRQDQPIFEIGDAANFVMSETGRLSKRYPAVKVAPLLYKVEDHLLYWVEEG